MGTTVFPVRMETGVEEAIRGIEVGIEGLNVGETSRTAARIGEAGREEEPLPVYERMGGVALPSYEENADGNVLL